MSSFTTLPTSNVNTTNDYFIIRQSGVDVKIKRGVFLGELYPTGATYETIDVGFTPSANGFPGTWALVEAGCTLVSSAVVDGDIGVPKGSDIHTVELVNHTHAVSMTMAGEHTHQTSSTPRVIDSVRKLGDTNAVTPTGTVETELSLQGIHSHTITISEQGVADNDIDVSGKRLNILVWLRTA